MVRILVANFHSLSASMPALLAQCKDIVSEHFNPPLMGKDPLEGGTEIVITNGNVDAINKVITTGLVFLH